MHQQYPPSVFFFLQLHTKEAGPLCVWQPCSLGPIVEKKLHRLVCSGGAQGEKTSPRRRRRRDEKELEEEKESCFGGGIGGSESAGGDALPRQAGQHTSGEKAEGGERFMLYCLR